MKNLHALLLLCAGLIFARTLAAGETGPDLLTPAERAWLAEHPDIVLGVGQEWAPAVVKDADGRFGGFAFDHLDLLNRKLGTHLRLEAGPWHAIVEQAETGRLAGLNLSAPVEARKAHFLFTQPFHAVQYFIYLRAGQSMPDNGLDGFRGRRVGYLKGTLYLQRLLEAHPAVEALPLDSTEALANALLKGDIDAALDSYSLEYWRVSHGVLGFAPMRMLPESQTKLVMSIRKDWPELVEILNKGLAAITREEMAELYRRWFGQDYLNRIAPKVALTAEELAWLAKHPVLRVSIDAHRAPVEFVDEAGKPQGISVVYLQRLEKLLGLRIEWVQGLAWAEAKQRLADGGLDVLPTMAMTPDRQRSIHFTEPYLSLPVAIFSAAEVAYLGDLRALAGKTVAIVQGEAIQDWLRQDWPQLTLLPVANTREALRKVAAGEAFAFVGNLVTTSYYIGQSGLNQIRVAGETPYAYELGMGVRGDWPLLVGILQKGLDAIPKNEQDAIYHDWISIQYQRHVDYGTLWTVVILAALALFVIVYWNRRLALEVSQRRRAEAALTQAKDQAEAANRAKSAFLANVSHDLRTPLNAVLGFSSLLRGKELSEKERGYLEAIRAAGKGLSQLIDDILNLSRIEADKIELRTQPVDPRALLRDLELMFGHPAGGKGLGLQVTVGEEVPSALLGDDIRLRQILVNLIGNAIKFTDAGHVEVRATGEEEGGKFHLRIAVADTGPGIPPDQQEDIFKLFTQRRGQDPARYGGTGLGLGICRRLAALMGGEIRLASTPGQGSTFTLVLPALTMADRAGAMEEPIHAVEDVAFAPARILVVDDNAPNRRLLVEYLSPYGFELIEAGDGPQALAQARQRRPALILMDIAMPVLDGLEVTRRLKADTTTADIPVIAVTASVTEKQEAEARTLCDAYLPKPVSQPTLIATLRRFLPHSKPAPPGANRPTLRPAAKIGDFRRRCTNACKRCGRPSLQSTNWRRLAARWRGKANGGKIPPCGTWVTFCCTRRRLSTWSACTSGLRRLKQRRNPAGNAFMGRDQSENGRRSILVADDDPHNVRAVGSLLKESGYQVHVADSGELALAIAGEVPLDLILLDIRMPRGVDGIETCRRLKADDRTRPIPVIFLTGKEDEETTVRAFAAGGADYVKKPFNAQVLLARVRTHTELGLLSRELERALAERTRELSDANAKLRQLAMEVSLIEEREKKRLAGDLHDSPMQKLALAQMQIASARKCRDGESDLLLESGLELLRDALRELRFLQFELSPPLLYQEGLAAALRWLASHASQRWGVDLSFIASDPFPTLDTDLSVILFQFARELVYNVIKHADASAGRIELEVRDNAVRLVVSDDGKGFPPAAAAGQPGAGGGYGLFSVRERLALLGGELSIESDARGVRASVRVPLTSTGKATFANHEGDSMTDKNDRGGATS